MEFYKSFSLVLISLFISCVSFAQNDYCIKTYFDGASDYDTVFLSSTNDIRDTALIIDKQAHFSLSEMDNKWRSYFITYKKKGKRFDTLIFHNAQSDINLFVDNEFTSISITGDTIATEQNLFHKELTSLTNEFRLLKKQLSETSDSLSRQIIKDKIYTFDKIFGNYTIKWVENHVRSPFSAAVIRIFIDKTNVLKALDTVAANCFRKLLPEAKENNTESLLLQGMYAMYDDVYSSVPVNSVAPMFVIKDTAGNDISLNTFSGKWLLIDFWASWCAPCRKNNPLLKDFFLQYHNKGLELLSISVDTNRELWKTAIIKDKMIWHQGSDLLGQQSGVGQIYQVNAVPYYLLITPDGHIIKKSLGGDIGVIKEALQKLIKAP